MATKKTDTWMPLYVTDYLGDTMHLTTEQHGAYLLLLMSSWKTGGTLPSDDTSLGAITRLGSAFKKSKDVLLAFFTVDGKTMTHKRVLIELQRAKTLNEARSEAGKKAMSNRWRKDQQDALQNDNSVIANAITKDQQDALQNDIPSPSPSPIPLIPERSNSKSLSTPSREAEACLAIKAAGIPNVNPQHPDLIALIAEGATTQDFTDAAPLALGKGNPFAYLLKILKNQREQPKATSSKASKANTRKADHGKHDVEEPV
jgi:uncharacterized protein YdaU (DUF1376 family)